MSKKREEKTLSWDAFQQLGNPDNAPEIEEDKDLDPIDKTVSLRVHLEKKGRGGKTDSIVRGWDGNDEELTALGQELKKHCGVGGNIKDNEIIIQGDQRKKIQALLIKKGFKNTKLAGG